MKYIIESLAIFLFVVGFSLLATYGFIGAVGEHTTAYNLTQIEPVKLYSSECGHFKGLKEYYTLCEVE